MHEAPFGSWPSVVSTQMLATASVELTALAVDGTDLYWVESRADEGGRASVWCQRAGGELTEITPAPFNVRSRVHEYGGGEYAARDTVVVFTSDHDGRVYARHGGGEPRAITPLGRTHRYGDLRVYPDRGLVLAVREEPEPEPVNTIVALELEGPNHEGGRVVCDGADFYASPELSDTGLLAWVEWDHPDMPWDATRLRAGRLGQDGVEDSQVIAGGPAESALHPRWTPAGTLVLVSDRTGWWNLYTWSGGHLRAVHETRAEYCGRRGDSATSRTRSLTTTTCCPAGRGRAGASLVS